MTFDQLIKDGFVHNIHLYIGDGFFYCFLCKNRVRHEAYSKEHDHRLVCTACKTVTRA